MHQKSICDNSDSPECWRGFRKQISTAVLELHIWGYSVKCRPISSLVISWTVLKSGITDVPAMTPPISAPRHWHAAKSYFMTAVKSLCRIHDILITRLSDSLLKSAILPGTQSIHNPSHEIFVCDPIEPRLESPRIGFRRHISMMQDLYNPCRRTWQEWVLHYSLAWLRANAGM
jgi:hypothetical protein